MFHVRKFPNQLSLTIDLKFDYSIHDDVLLSPSFVSFCTVTTKADFDP